MPGQQQTAVRHHHHGHQYWQTQTGISSSDFYSVPRMASRTPKLSFSLSGGAVIATIPSSDPYHGQHTALDTAPQHPESTTSISITIASASECDSLGPRYTSQLLRYLSESPSFLPMFLTIPRKQGVILFWPHAQYARARVGLQRVQFTVSANTSRSAMESRQQSSHFSLNVDCFLQLARAAATFSPQYASVVDDVYQAADLVEQTYPSPSVHVRRQIAIIRSVAVARLDSRDHRVLSQANALVALDPTSSAAYLHRAQSLYAAGQFWFAVLDVWYAVLKQGDQQFNKARAVSVLVRCLSHLPHVGLDIIFVSQKCSTCRTLQESFPAPYDCLMWHHLTFEQKNVHFDIINAVWSCNEGKKLLLSGRQEAVHEYVSTCTPYIWSTGRQEGVATLTQLPEMFTWLIPLRVACSAMISSKAQITAMKDVGFTIVLSLTMEQPLLSSWFSECCRNVFLPLRRGRAPSFHQIDAFVAKVANARKVLIHSMDGKGRIWPLMGVWLMLFGFSSSFSLCSKCSSDQGSNDSSKFIGCCKDPTCALMARQPVMSAQESMAFLKRQRVGVVMSYDQEKFLTDFNSELWRRYSLLKDVEQSVISSELVYHTEMSVKEHDAELQVVGRPLQKVPSLVVLCGLPGSGKSFLADRLVNLKRERFTVVSQDILGSRESCASLVSTTARNGGICTIVDRCNPKLSDRKEWMRCAFCPNSAIIVYVDTPLELCTIRAERRIDHPTLTPGAAGRVIQSVSKSFEVPNQRDLQTGYDGIYIIRGRISCDVFIQNLKRFLVTDDPQKGCALLSDSLDKHVVRHTSYLCSSSTHVCGNHDVQMENEELKGNNEHINRKLVKPVGSEGQSSGSVEIRQENYVRRVRTNSVKRHFFVETAQAHLEPPLRLPGFVKFPRTRHILDLGGSVAGDDIVMDNADLKQMIKSLNTARREKDMKVTVEEKVDGANLGFSICPESKRILVQNRSHYVNTKSHSQFKLVDFFTHTYEKDLRKVLRDGERVLYGEWMYAKHSILYSKLPSVFLAFDLLDRTENRFLSRTAFRKEMENTEICTVEEVRLPSHITVSTIKELALNCKSHYYEGRAEGLYFRIDGEKWLVDRAKIVRPDFIVGNEHWNRRPPERNRFESI